MTNPAGSSVPLKVGCSSGSCCGGTCRDKACVLSYIAPPLRLALGGLFLFAAYNKLLVENGPQVFSASVKAFKVIDPEGAPALFQLAVYATPWIEIVAGISLVIGFWTRAAAGVLAAMLVVFIALITSVLMRGLDTKCGCFGKLSPFCGEQVGVCNIVQNTILMAMALTIANARTLYFSVDRLLARRGEHGATPAGSTR
ncbi:MAG: DoxX family protein [Phycisphaerales bacterium]